MAQKPNRSTHIEELETLIRRGTTAARLGDREQARETFRQASRLDPTSVEAWLGLSGVVGTLTEKRQCFQRVLELDPTNAEAQEGLEAVERRFSGRDEDSLATFTSPSLPQDQQTTPAQQPATEVCYRHPGTETGLHCVQCGRPICARCSQLTPVGQLCPDCRRERRSPNYKVGPLDVLKGFIAGLIAGAIGAIVARFIGGFWFFFLFFGLIIGEGVMRVIGYATNKRGRVMQITAAAAVLIGAGLVTLVLWIPLPGLVIFLIFAISTVVARLR